ncbi:energy transducer TonB family protein [Donghicola mangrovi]|uniref:TonB family protein n=1 Tax=Donghicola mangrovi TaxID=2729614 RepID=A0A850QF42_9RHOB|nr:energy transducer TonB [Donghicola mangrovi]NVO25005.1 TonB family protein [Donghicola mangrovi]
MRSAIEFGGFLMLATVLHGGVALIGAPEGGVQSAGAGGADLMSLTASSESVAAMVAAWDAPPPAPAAPPVMQAPTPVMTAPEMPIPSVPDMPVIGLALPQAEVPPTAPELPTVDHSTPDPAPKMTSLSPPVRPTPPVRTKPAKVAPKASAASSASNGAKASGAGDGTAAGTQGSAQVATLSPARERSLIAEWGASIRARIARNVPRGAGKGTATLRVVVGSDGALHGVTLAQSSGDAQIDRLALLAVERAGPFPAAPKGLKAHAQSFKLPIQSR